MPEQCLTTTVQMVGQVLDELAPPALAAPWDTSIGLLIGDPFQPVSRVLLTLDVTDRSLAQARASGCELIITHHPLLFKPLPTARRDIPEQRLVLDMAIAGISLIAAHTNLDAAPGGVADSLADTLGLPQTGRLAAGAFGRIGELPAPISLSCLLHHVDRLLGGAGSRPNTDQDGEIRRLAVFPGSFPEEELSLLEELGADGLVCGELKHHVGLMLAARGILAVESGHDVTERVVLRPLAERLAERLPQLTFEVHEGFDYNKMAFRASQTTAGAG